MRLPNSSGSSCCESGVEPTRSQKSTVSWRRSPTGNAASFVGAGGETAIAGDTVGSRSPQPPQKLSPGSFDTPHAAQTVASATPHFAQKRRSARLSWLQDGQRIVAVLASGDYHAGPKL